MLTVVAKAVNIKEKNLNVYQGGAINKLMVHIMKLYGAVTGERL